MGGSGNLPVGPGIWGFIAFFVLAVALWFLVRNMNSRLRRMAYRDRDEADQPQTGDTDGTRVTEDDEIGGSRPHIDRRAVEEERATQEERGHDGGAAEGRAPRS
jgi:hypothetical protein